MRTIAKNSKAPGQELGNAGSEGNQPNANPNTPKPLKTDQEILEELKAAGGGERRRSVGLTAFVILLALVIGIFTIVNRQTENKNQNTTNNKIVATETNKTNTTKSNETKQTNKTNETAKTAKNVTKNTTVNTANTTANVTATDTEEEAEEAENVANVTISTNIAGSSHSETEFTETAQVGEGVTNLARRAVKTYMADKGITNLNAEQKIYIEDYLTKHSNPVLLDIGNTRTFSTSLMDQAIAQAQTLTAAQIQNLSQYATLVPGL